MPSIVTITFSPCIDKSTSIAAMVPEKKLSCKAPVLEPGGGGINVARAIKKLGGEAIAIFPSGGYTGKYFNHLLENEKISSVIIETTNETRENIIVLDESTNNQYRFGMPGTRLQEDEWKKCLSAVEHIDDIRFIVASGSLPPGVPLNIYAELAKMAKIKQAKLVVDTSGEALKHALDEGVFLIKPNLGELSFLAGKKELKDPDILSFSRELIANGSCEVMIVSMGAAGAMLITGDIAAKIVPPAVNRKSTVGAGDSMLAGMIYSLSAGKSLLQSAQYAVACGTAATLNPGTALCQKEDAERLFAMIQSGDS